MREIIAVCRSEKRARDHVAQVLDRYFWRIGDRTWRGKATNACLDRVSRELRKRASRNTAVIIHEIRSSHESRHPLIRIGARHAFSDDGLVPVSSHPAAFSRRNQGLASEQTGAAILAIAALFHDLGKATVAFQAKLRRALATGENLADSIRHELFSAAVWDCLCGNLSDGAIQGALKSLTPALIDSACLNAADRLKALPHLQDPPLDLHFAARPQSLSGIIGLLILTHHRLPEADSDHLTLNARAHIRPDPDFQSHRDLAIAPGLPFWHEAWWTTALQTATDGLQPGSPLPASADIILRASLMMADHFASAKKTISAQIPEHLANTKGDAQKKLHPADSLSRHVKNVWRYTRFSHAATHQLRGLYPALSEEALPEDLVWPPVAQLPRFAWQRAACEAGRNLVQNREGGFFAAVLAGTGTGKTRGAPAIIAAAALNDARPERRGFRMNLGLGLRVLAMQSAREYVQDLGFDTRDVAVLIGDPPLKFSEDPDPDNLQEDPIALPDWLRVEQVHGTPPPPGDPREEAWLRRLSLDTGRGLPAFIEKYLREDRDRAEQGRKLLLPPVLVCTLDHLMAVAAPVNRHFLTQSLRLITSDLVLDEIDQYGPEDIAAIARLIYQTGAAGRRVLIMSATLNSDIMQPLYQAYHQGWSDHARAAGIAEHVHLLLSGDQPDTVFTNAAGETAEQLFEHCRQAVLRSLHAAPLLRRAQILPAVSGWADLVAQIDQALHNMHHSTAVPLEGFQVSVGLVRLTRIAHVNAAAVQLPSGPSPTGLRVVLCLHSQIPRVQRAWIEDILRKALTRKNPAPESGLQALCREACLFERARAAETRDIEIVVLSSPVIETGNDLDFDYAILDPSSTRALVQAAGRVRRHRDPPENPNNILILGRSVIALQSGALTHPGVETPSALETQVSRISRLAPFEGRHFRDLLGPTNLERLSAAAILATETAFPLRDAEAELQRNMLNTAEAAPLGRYLNTPLTRWNRRMTRSRRFRRSETDEAVFFLDGETWENSEWYLDTGNRFSRPSLARNLQASDLPDTNEWLFPDIAFRSWTAWLEKGESNVSLKDLFRVSVPAYESDHPDSHFLLTEQTGITRGDPKDLFAPFGKTP